MNTMVFFGISTIVVVSCFVVFGVVQKSDYVRFYVQLCKSSSSGASLAPRASRDNLHIKLSADSNDEVCHSSFKLQPLSVDH
jgi:hypothetical protein